MVPGVIVGVGVGVIVGVGVGVIGGVSVIGGVRSTGGPELPGGRTGTGCSPNPTMSERAETAPRSVPLMAVTSKLYGRKLTSPEKSSEVRVTRITVNASTLFVSPANRRTR